jgi:hypothetical protein
MMKAKSNEKIGWALAACVWLTALVACDQLSNGSENGEKVAVRFAVGGLESWGAETVVRGASPTPVEAASVALEDDWVLKVDLMEDPAPATRATLGVLSAGTVIRVVATNGSSIADEENYVCQTDGSLEPESDPIMVEPGNYYMLAYSYNTPALAPPTSAGTTVLVSPYNDGTVTNDLIVGRTASTVAIPGDGNIPSLTLKHLFYRVKYEINNAASGPNLEDITVSLTDGYDATLTKTSGTLTHSSLTAEQPLDDTDHRIIYIRSNTSTRYLTLRVSLKVNGVALTRTMYFTNSLVAGTSYILRMNVKKITWAGSNIYWEPNLHPGWASDRKGGLTFAPSGDRSKENYQGVFFRWGSLVGSDPTNTNIGTGITSWSSSMYLYTPTYNSSAEADSYWTAATGKTWNDTNVPYMTYTNSQGLPYDVDFLSGAADYANKKGDICRYLSAIGAVSGSYRMPTASELLLSSNHDQTIYQSGVPAANYWTRVGGSSWSYVATNSSGTGVIPFGANHNDKTVFPAAGNVGNNDGTIFEVGYRGRYWSSTPASMYTANVLFFSESLSREYYTGSMHLSSSVRCLLDN